MRDDASPRLAAVRQLVVPAVFALLTLVFFRGYWADPFRLTPAGAADASQMIWFLRWVPFAITHGHNPLVTTWVLYPGGANLMWNTSILFPSLVMGPVTAVAGPVFAYDALHSAAFALSGWTAYWAIHRLTGSLLGAVVGGALYAFSPFMLGEGLGHAQLFVAIYPPLVLVLLHALVTSSRTPWRPGVLLGLATAAQLLTGEELLAMTFLAGALGVTLAAFLNFGEVNRLAGRVATGVAVSLAVFAPLAAIPLWTQFAGPQRPGGTLHTDAGIYHADLLTLIAPSGMQQVAPTGLVAPAGVLHGAYAGLPLIILVGLGMVLLRPTRLYVWSGILAVTMFLLSMGDTLSVGGRSTRIPLPWRLFDHLPLLGNTLPIRWAGIGYLFAGIVVAGVVARAQRPGIGSRVAYGALGAAAVVALLPTLNYPVGPQEAPAFFRPRGAVERIHPGDVAVMVPFIDEGPTAMMWQAIADMRYRTPGGYLFIPGPSYPILYAPPSPLRNALNSAEADRPLAPLDEASRSAMAADLERWRARAVIVGPMANQGRTVAFVAALLRRPPQATGGVYVWWDVRPAEVR